MLLIQKINGSIYFKDSWIGGFFNQIENGERNLLVLIL